MTEDLYKDRWRRLDTVAGSDSSYWYILGQVAAEIKSDRMMDGDWVARCEELYGFRPVYSDDGGIVGRPEIIDPKKYMLCVLKFGG